MKITIEKYNPKWKDEFETEKQLLITCLNSLDIEIEHIGSTSVKGLGAKPIIDIMIGLKDFSHADKQIKVLKKLGYSYISKYNEIMPDRLFFTKENNGKRTHHIHMVEIGKDFWIKHIKFRDHLRNNKSDRDKYYRFKKELAERDWTDGDEYANVKSEFITKIENKATATNSKYR